MGFDIVSFSHSLGFPIDCDKVLSLASLEETVTHFDLWARELTEHYP